MAKAYWIATYRSVKDPAALEAYAKLAGPAIWNAGGRNLVRGMPARTLEDGLNHAPGGGEGGGPHSRGGTAGQAEKGGPHPATGHDRVRHGRGRHGGLRNSGLP